MNGCAELSTSAHPQMNPQSQHLIQGLHGMKPRCHVVSPLLCSFLTSLFFSLSVSVTFPCTPFLAVISFISLLSLVSFCIYSTLFLIQTLCFMFLMRTSLATSLSLAKLDWLCDVVAAGLDGGSVRSTGFLFSLQSKCQLGHTALHEGQSGCSAAAPSSQAIFTELHSLILSRLSDRHATGSHERAAMFSL